MKVAAVKLKANCLALIDQVHDRRHQGIRSSSHVNCCCSSFSRVARSSPSVRFLCGSPLFPNDSGIMTSVTGS
jgi:hypothetical protein